MSVQYKIALLGEIGVGKTSILIKYTANEFDTNIMHSNGIGQRDREVRLRDKKVTALLLDTGGQEKYRAITKAYFSGSHGAMFIYDITNPKSFEMISV